MKTLKVMRSVFCNKFLTQNGVNCVSLIDEEADSKFSQNGCDCCQSLACDTYETEGYSPKTRLVVSTGDVCRECLCYFYNGDDSETDHDVESDEVGA